MSSDPIPLSRPTRLAESEAAAVAALRAGSVDGYGPANVACERWLEAHFGAPALLLSSGTHALELAALALDLGPGDEVLVPSFAFVTTANAFARQGTRLRFVDCDGAGNLDLDGLERALSPRARAVVPIHYGGGSGDVERLVEICRRAGVALVEDAAQSIGATFDGRPLGGFGAFGCLSFDSLKNVTAGQGGALIVNDARLVDRAHRIRDRGTNRRDFRAGRVAAYEWTDLGSNFSLSDLNAALLLPQLERLGEINARRRELWRRYAAALAAPLAERGVDVIGWGGRVRPNHHLFATVWPGRARRDRFLAGLGDAGIQAAFHYTALHLSPFGRRFVEVGERFPGAERLADGLVRLPLYDALESRDQERVIACVLEVVRTV